jgi:hypothetical protein
MDATSTMPLQLAICCLARLSQLDLGFGNFATADAD